MARSSSRAPKIPTQLRALHRTLRADHPELLGVGIGCRRRRGEMTSEMTVKFIVDGKYTRMPRGRRRLPKRVELIVDGIDGPEVVELATDIEVLEPIVPSYFPVGRSAFRETVASALAAWPAANGGHTVGVVTTAHGLPVPDADVTVMANRGSSDDPQYVNLWGRARHRTNVSARGLDVGLVDIDFDAEFLIDIETGEHAIATDQQILLWLQTTGEDGLWIRPLNQRTQDTLLVTDWFERLPLPQVGGGTITLRSVVRCVSPDGSSVFPPGTSGSTWRLVDEDVVVAIQSVSKPTGPASAPVYATAYGNTVHAARRWLRRKQSGLELAWSRDAFWNVHEIDIG